ncbi:hypothetical protein ACFP1Z_09080 [Streptomyces gamaensis]|uniref:DUF397 domain-containing protein n=1 Tax=Streptomyces gamaensis TaxID=1763542 RepID=A0ABW0YXG6_9ACTN
MKLTLIAGGSCSGAGNGDCDSGDCPSVFATDRGTIAVQGHDVDHETPEGESMVEIPQELLREAARVLGW